MVAGSGTSVLLPREVLPGRRPSRWWGGKLISGMAMAVARRFDGTNETEVEKWIRERYANVADAADRATTCSGLLPRSETTTIAAGLNDVVMDHFTDAVDRAGRRSIMVLAQRSDGERSTPGQLDRELHGLPAAATTGRISPTSPTAARCCHSRDAFGDNAFTVIHRVLHDAICSTWTKARRIPLYELDMQELRRKSAAVLPYAMFSLAQYNLGLIADAVPNRVFSRMRTGFRPVVSAASTPGGQCAVHDDAPPRERSPPASTGHRAGSLRCAAAGRWCPLPDLLAVGADHPSGVGEPAAMVHQEAAAAREFVGLLGDHPNRQFLVGEIGPRQLERIRRVGLVDIDHRRGRIVAPARKLLQGLLFGSTWVRRGAS